MMGNGAGGNAPGSGNPGSGSPGGGQRPGVFDVPVPGTIIAGKYEIEAILGCGGMGIVAAARHVQLAQRVAIKFMRAEAARDENAVGRFVREARAAAALANEHVTRVLDVGTLEDGAPYMVMEYLAGVDVGQLLARDGRLPVPLAVEVVLQACEAIAEAHSRGIVHRDLKPANLFATTRPDGTRLIKVLDFGISKGNDFGGTESGPSFTASGIAMGSPGYMSPEQVRSAKGVDARSDVWSLGVILYELLTNVSPFVGETMGDTLARIVSEDPPPVGNHRSDVPPELAAVVAQCLARRVDARIQSVAQLAERLVPFADGEALLSVKRILRLAGTPGGTIAAPLSLLSPQNASTGPSPTGQAWLRSGASVPKTSHVRLFSLLGAGLLLVVTGVVALSVVNKPAPQAPGPASRAATAASSTPGSSGAPAASEVLIPPPADPPPRSPAPPTTAEATVTATNSAQRHEADSPPAPSPGVVSGPGNPTHHTPGVPTPSATHTRSRGSAATCDPPFTIDSAGHRVPKPECL